MHIGLLPSRQRGVAMILALLVAALAVTLVSSLFWPQQVAQRAVENQWLRHEARAHSSIALDDARGLLRRDAMLHGSLTTLDGAWSQGRDGSIVDAQSRYNLGNLAPGGRIDAAQVRCYQRLLALLGMDPGLAQRTALALAQPDQLAPVHMDDLLAIAGYTPAAVAALKAVAVILPEPAAINVNTAAPEVLAAGTGMPLAQARAFVRSRNQAHLRGAADIALRLPPASVPLGVHSEYFLLEQRISQGRASLHVQALLRRKAGGRMSDDVLPTAIVWLRSY